MYDRQIRKVWYSFVTVPSSAELRSGVTPHRARRAYSSSAHSHSSGGGGLGWQWHRAAWSPGTATHSHAGQTRWHHADHTTHCPCRQQQHSPTQISLNHIPCSCTSPCTVALRPWNSHGYDHTTSLPARLARVRRYLTLHPCRPSLPAISSTQLTSIQPAPIIRTTPYSLSPPQLLCHRHPSHPAPPQPTAARPCPATVPCGPYQCDVQAAVDPTLDGSDDKVSSTS